MEIIQLIIIGITLIIYIGLLLSFKKQNITINQFLMWNGIWIVLLITAIYPQWLSVFNNIGITSELNLAIYGSIILLFYLMFGIYEKIDKIQQEISKLVTKIAIEKKK